MSSQVLFISHQWLGARAPDPSGQQLLVLRQALRRFMDKSLLVEEDLTRMFRSFQNATSYEQAWLRLLVVRDRETILVESVLQVSELYKCLLLTCHCLRFQMQVADGYLFLDWFAIPQITARTDGVNEDATRSDAALAVQSIPAYVEACDA